MNRQAAFRREQGNTRTEGVVGGRALLAATSTLVLVSLGACADGDDRPEASRPSDAVAATASPTPTASGEPSSPGTAPRPGAAVLTETTLGRLPVPRTGDDAVELLEAMPDRLGTWATAPGDRGQAFYQHPAGTFGIEAGELTDIYPQTVSPAEAVRLYRYDLDGRRGKSCSTPPGRCVTGRLDGQHVVAFTHDHSEVILVAVWPDEPAREQLLRAYRDASERGWTDGGTF